MKKILLSLCQWEAEEQRFQKLSHGIECIRSRNTQSKYKPKTYFSATPPVILLIPLGILDLKQIYCQLFISPTKMALFRMSKELKFYVCDHGKPHAIPKHIRERNT